MERLDAWVVRARADNPSPMTLSGTNTYVIGGPRGHDVLVVDPGPDAVDHYHAVDVAIAGRTVVGVVVTHHHRDHTAAIGWAADWDAPVLAFDPARVTGARVLTDGDAIAIAGGQVVARHMPGHTADHVCLWIAATRVLLTGDLILGHGTSVIAWPDGELDAYLRSLAAVRALAPSALYPGHGDVVADSVARVDALVAHRGQRSAQIIAAVRGGATTTADVVAVVYPDLAAALQPAAVRSATAHLVALQRAGRLTRSGERWDVG